MATKTRHTETRNKEVTNFVAQIRSVFQTGACAYPLVCAWQGTGNPCDSPKKHERGQRFTGLSNQDIGYGQNVTYLCTEDQKNVYVTAWAAKNFGELFKQCMYAGCSQGLVQFPASNYEVENALIYDNGPAFSLRRQECYLEVGAPK